MLNQSGCQKRSSIFIFCTLFISCSITACVTAPTGTGIKVPHNQTTYRATVNGGTNPGALSRLQAFDTNLKQLLAVTNLDERYVGCTECPGLLLDPTITKLTYWVYREHQDNLLKLTEAWDSVHKQQNTPADFSISFDTAPPPLPICSTKPKQPCSPAATCTQTDRCDLYPNQNGCQSCN